MRVARPVFAILGVLLLPPPGSAQIDPVAKVHAVFTAYQQALRAHDGPAAVQLVTQTTLDSYGRFRDAALHATAEELRASPLYERLIVLNLRLRFSAGELTATNAEGVFQSGVTEAWAAPAPAADSSLEDLIVRGTQAEGRVSSGGAQATIRFFQEGGAWKVDLAASAVEVEQGLRAYVAAHQIPEDKMIEDALRASYGKPLPDNLWQPLLP